MRNVINFNHLECFFSLAKTLSFSKTAKQLMIAQPAVSKQIKALEAQFGMQLFLRTKHMVQLTATGKQLYDKIYPLYHEINSRVEDITSSVGKIKGKITFGCLEEVGEKVFIHALNEFKKQNELIQFEVKFLKAFEIVEGIKNGTLNLGIVPDKILQEEIRIYEILKEEIILTTNAKNAANKITKVTDLPFVLYRENDPLTMFYLKKVYPKSKLNKLNVEFSVNSHKAMLEVLKTHDVYAILPTLSIQNELKNKELINVGVKNLETKLYLIHLEQEYLDKKVEVLRDFIKSYVKEHFA
ncbi:MAG: LysR family transcriptional regulator [Bacteriovoracaceae bacterium]|nr:LysR family transcriptional regulator [Bacteriovoracaceae bacterium]